MKHFSETVEVKEISDKVVNRVTQKRNQAMRNAIIQKNKQAKDNAVDRIERNMKLRMNRAYRQMNKKTDAAMARLKEDGSKDVSSMKTKVKTAMSALSKMNTELSKLPDDGDLPTWWTNKVAVAVDKLDGMADYLDTQVENLEESPLNTQSITGLKIMADRMVKKLSGEGLQRRVQLMTQIGKILGIKVKILPNGKIELK